MRVMRIRINMHQGRCNRTPLQLNASDDRNDFTGVHKGVDVGGRGSLQRILTLPLIIIKSLELGKMFDNSVFYTNVKCI